MAKEANISSFEDLKRKFPEKVSESIAEKFAVTMGKKQNRAGILLKWIIKLGSESTSESVKTEDLQNIIDFGPEKLKDFDAMILIWLRKKTS